MKIYKPGEGPKLGAGVWEIFPKIIKRLLILDPRVSKLNKSSLIFLFQCPKSLTDISKRLHYKYVERTIVTTICVLLLLIAEVVDVVFISLFDNFVFIFIKIFIREALMTKMSKSENLETYKWEGPWRVLVIRPPPSSTSLSIN